VRLVLHASEAAEPYSSAAISRARKKMMAEIALAGDEILIDDISYSRNDAATLLDVVGEESWKAHNTIYKHTGLLNFLEKGEFNSEELRKADAWLYNEKFVQAVSPYFAHSFNTVAGKLLRKNDFEEVLKLMDYRGYILPEHSHDAYQKLRGYLEDINYTLRNLSWEKFIGDESILHFIFSGNWLKFINKLPSSFTSVRDELVEHFINLVLRFQHKATWYYLHKVLVQLKGIETNDFNRSEVVRIDEVIYKNSKIEGGKGTVRSKGSDGYNWRSAWWIIWIVLMIVRAATCNDKSSKGSYDVRDNTYDPIEIDRSSYAERENEKKVLSLLDSLGKKQNPVITPQKLKTGDQPFKSFGNDPGAAVNHSVTITNNTGYDAVFLYFKDVPGHAMSGVLPKLYSTYIKNGEIVKVYVLPGNGRVYFAFGEGWGKLEKPFTIDLNNRVGGFTNSGSLPQTITVESFFNNKKGRPRQTYLQLPVFINGSDAYRDTTTYHYLNKVGKSSDGETGLHLTQVNGKFTIEAMGRLLVKEERHDTHD
jgi:hypothetical protein